MRISMHVCALALMVSAMGCTSDDQDPVGQPTSTPTSTPPAAEEPLTLREVCPEIEAALPDDYGPQGEKVAEFLGVLADLEEQGDTETKNAIDLLRPAVVELHDAVATDAPGLALLDARAGLRDGISAVADRCSAAGSSALQ